MTPSVHFEAERFSNGERGTACHLRGFVVLTTTLASQVTCKQCLEIDQNGPNDDLRSEIK